MQVHTLPTAQVPSVLTDSFSWSHDPFTHACKARPVTVVGWTSLGVIVIIIGSPMWTTREQLKLRAHRRLRRSGVSAAPQQGPPCRLSQQMFLKPEAIHRRIRPPDQEPREPKTQSDIAKRMRHTEGMSSSMMDMKSVYQHQTVRR